MISLKVNLNDGASPALAELISALTGSMVADLNAVAGRAATEYAGRYHREFDARGGWANPGGRTWGPGRESTGYGSQVASAWYFKESDPGGATIANAAPHLRHKVKGGTITAKRVKALTIPMIPEAHGRRARDYEDRFGRKLFTVKGKNVLFEKTADGGVRGVYALVRSVTQKPWPGALPPDEDLLAAFSNAWREEMADRLEDL